MRYQFHQHALDLGFEKDLKLWPTSSTIGPESPQKVIL